LAKTARAQKHVANSIDQLLITHHESDHGKQYKPMPIFSTMLRFVQAWASPRQAIGAAS
jgi:hypothetical protein